MCQCEWTDVLDGSKGGADGQMDRWTDKWTEKEVSGVTDGKVSGAAGGKVSGAMDTDGKVSGRAAGVGVPLTETATNLYIVALDSPTWTYITAGHSAWYVLET
jgi:hypothetical protein